jgi:hypothetical protein
LHRRSVLISRASSPVIGVSRSVSKAVGHHLYFRRYYLVTVVLTVTGAMRKTSAPSRPSLPPSRSVELSESGHSFVSQ